MLPNWLEVPAAEHPRSLVPLTSDKAACLNIADIRGERPRSLAPDAAWARKSQWGQGQGARLAVFLSDPRLAAALEARASESAYFPLAFAVLGRDLAPLLRQQGLELDVVHSDTPAPAAERAAAVDLGGVVDATEARHWLDVSLSVGRHAAERAKLAGFRRLGCVGASGSQPSGAQRRQERGGREPLVAGLPGPSIPARADRFPLQLCGPKMGGQKVYEGLVRGGDFEITAMVGAMIACAQMGLEVVVWGAQGKTAAELAACLCPGAKPWLRRSASSSEGVEVAATPTARESLALTGS